MPDGPRVLTRFPPLIYAIAVGAAVGLQALFTQRVFPPEPFFLIGIGCYAVAAVLIFWGFYEFKRHKTAVRPGPVNNLIRRGPYRVSRNPLYLGMTIVVIGMAFSTDNVWMLVVSPPLLAVMHWGVIRPEERYLEERFGDEYRAYRASVRRWI